MFGGFQMLPHQIAKFRSDLSYNPVGAFSPLTSIPPAGDRFPFSVKCPKIL